MRIRSPSRFLLLGLFLFLLLLVLNGSAFFTYRQVRGTIEQELGGRLLSVATATAAGISAPAMRGLIADPSGAEAAALQDVLARIAFDTEIGDLYLFNVERSHLLDAAGRFFAPMFQ